MKTKFLVDFEFDNGARYGVELTAFDTDLRDLFEKQKLTAVDVRVSEERFVQLFNKRNELQ